MSNVLDVIQPSYSSVIGNHRVKALSLFKASLDSGLESNSVKGLPALCGGALKQLSMILTLAALVCMDRLLAFAFDSICL